MALWWKFARERRRDGTAREDTQGADLLAKSIEIVQRLCVGQLNERAH